MQIQRPLLGLGIVLSFVGLIINAGLDFDNDYDMTLVGLWAILLVIYIVAFSFQKKVPQNQEKLEASQKEMQ